MLWEKRLKLRVPCCWLCAIILIILFTVNVPCKRETRLLWECDQKRDQEKGKALEIYFRTFCHKSNTRNFNLEIYLSNCVGCPLKWLIFLPKQNATYMSGTPFPTLLSFLPLLPESVRTCRCMLTSLPNVLRWIDCQIILAIGLRSRALAPQIINLILHDLSFKFIY